VSFLLKCPNCGERSVYEFRFGGEYRPRPARDAPDSVWVEYVYSRENKNGVHREWWYHRDGCGAWFLAQRDTVTNNVLATGWPESAEQD
jgi:sarcosine oxidase, subunit delta